MPGVDYKGEPTPFPRIGEVVRAIGGLLDTRSSSGGIGKRLDRFAREDSFDLTEGRDVFRQCVKEPLSKVAPVLTDLLDQAGNRFLDQYAKVVLAIQVDALERDDVLGVLRETWLPSVAAVLLDVLARHQPGPDLPALLDMDRRPVAVVFDCFIARLAAERSLSPDEVKKRLAECYAPRSAPGRGRDAERDNALHTVRDWMKGERPSFRSISLLRQRLVERPRDGKGWPADLAEGLATWLLVARALDKADEACHDSGGIRRTLLQTLLTGLVPVDIPPMLSTMNTEQGRQRAPELLRTVFETEALFRRTQSKGSGAYTQAEQVLCRLEQEWGDVDLPTGARYMLYWLRARFHMLSGLPARALEPYRDAFALAAYCAGPNQVEILRELLIVAAQLGDQVAIRNHYRWAIAFGLFQAGRSNPEKWEVDRLRQAYPQRFPATGLYPDAPAPDAKGPPRIAFPVSVIPDMSTWRPNLASPNQRVKLGGLRKPQLCWAAMFDRLDALDGLLRRRADINALSDSNESALFLALGCAIQGQGSECLHRLLREPSHSPESLNAATTKKQATALQYAIDLADPGVVRRLLDLGADPNGRCTVDQMTPLYYAIQLLLDALHPDEYPSPMEASAPNADVLRRFASAPGGVFDGDYTAAWSAAREHPIAKALAECIKEQETRRNPDALRAIVGILLEHGGNPNARQNHIDRSPMHFAAEAGDIRVFQQLESCGGKRDTACWELAVRFNRREMAEWLVAQRLRDNR